MMAAVHVCVHVAVWTWLFLLLSECVESQSESLPFGGAPACFPGPLSRACFSQQRVHQAAAAARPRLHLLLSFQSWPLQWVGSVTPCGSVWVPAAPDVPSCIAPALELSSYQRSQFFQCSLLRSPQARFRRGRPCTGGRSLE